MATDYSKVELDVEHVFELLEQHDQFLRALQNVIQGKRAEGRREHLSIVASDDDNV
jgi:hypothetical protein